MILIAESKTMAQEAAACSRQEQPEFEATAMDIMKSVGAMTPAEVQSMLHCSGAMALKALDMARAFGVIPPYLRAMDAFTGVVFRALDEGSLSEKARLACTHQVRIVSSVYGLLRPDDAVLPYRMEYGAQVPGMWLPLKKFWRTKLTISLGRWMKSCDEPNLILVLPADAMACLDLKTLRGLGTVAIVELRTYSESGRLTTPKAERLKNRRGLLVRQLLEGGVDSAEGLEHFSSPDFEYLGQQPYPGHYAFLC